jgi:hypothetical protein
VPPQPYPEYRRSGLYPSLCAHKTNTTYVSLLHSIAGHVAFLKTTHTTKKEKEKKEKEKNNQKRKRKITKKEK